MRFLILLLTIFLMPLNLNSQIKVVKLTNSGATTVTNNGINLGPIFKFCGDIIIPIHNESGKIRTISNFKVGTIKIYKNNGNLVPILSHQIFINNALYTGGNIVFNPSQTIGIVIRPIILINMYSNIEIDYANISFKFEYPPFGSFHENDWYVNYWNINGPNYLKGCIPPHPVNDEPYLKMNSLSPNPPINELNVEYELSNNSIVSIYILDSFGNILKTLFEKKEHDKGIYNIKEAIYGFPKQQVYHILILTPNEVLREPFIKY